jgi:hypothetical protein
MHGSKDPDSNQNVKDPEHCHLHMGKETDLRFRLLGVVFLTDPPFPGRQEILARDERHGVATAGRSGSTNRAAVHRRSVLPSRLEHHFSLDKNYSTPKVILGIVLHKLNACTKQNWK